MLRELHIRDLALIEDVWLEFAPGMTVLSGETGAGKTALVGALKLLVGERGDSTLVRAGAQEARVEGAFLVGEREILAKRRIGADGRSRCTLDGEMSTVGALAEHLGPLIDLHGQHEHQSLLQPARHVGYLDRFAGDTATRVLMGYRERLGEYHEAVDALVRLERSLDEAEKRADYLRFVVAEIESAAPTEGEDELIGAKIPVLQHSERLAAASGEAYLALRGEGGASDIAGVAVSALARTSGLDPVLDELMARLRDALVSIEDIGMELRSYGEGLEHAPGELDALQARAATLAGLKKKHGPSLTDVLRTGAEAAEGLAALDDGGRALERARAGVEAARAALSEAGEALIALRAGVVEEFLTRLHAALEDLSMKGARFEVEFEDLALSDWTEDGPHKVEFMYAPGAGQPFRPLARIASGGEISRVMLALKGVLGSADDVPVLVFDEIDAGIGGATALDVGRRLRSLAERHQVLVVTHLAQVAVFADAHMVVEKTSDDDGVHTAVRTVDAEARVEEVARMLSGADSEASRIHARELLESARS